MRNWLLTLGVLLAMLQCATQARCEIYSLDEAREMYKAGKYAEAAPTFAHELKRKSNNGSLNHWYGVCLYEIGRCEEAVPYLIKGASRKIKLSNYYLGKAYLSLYKFDDAINAFTAYFDILEDDDKEPTDENNRLLSSAKLGKRMLRGVEQVQIIDSISVDSLSFINHYKLSQEAGRLVGCDDLPKDLQVDSSMVAFMPQRGDMIYTAIKSQSGNYDLQQSGRLLGGEWSTLQSMSEVLNNDDNQRFPYLLNDGQTLYFAQDGESSLGGLDIYVTMFNSERGDYMLPQNIGMPFNSLYNDYMMAIDETTGVGWFVTDRNHIPGQLTIYLFIPNANKKVYADIDEDSLRNLAMLTSIADTWQEGSDYTDLLAAVNAIKTDAANFKQPEFFFVLCNGIVYTNSSDFKNDVALKYFNQARSAQRKLDDKQAALSDLRKRYVAATQSDKAVITEQILTLEEELLNVTEQPVVYENRARNAELSFINANN